MKIQCAECGIELGEIRDGTLRKGIVYLCARCGEIESPADNYKNTQVPDFMQALFKGKQP